MGNKRGRITYFKTIRPSQKQEVFEGLLDNLTIEEISKRVGITKDAVNRIIEEKYKK